MKVIFIGQPGVGKSTLINALVDQHFNSNQAATLNVSIKKMDHYNEKFFLWDTPGYFFNEQNQQSTLPDRHLISAGTVVIVLAPNRNGKLSDLSILGSDKMKTLLENDKLKKANILIVVNKSDLLTEPTSKAQDNIEKKLDEANLRDRIHDITFCSAKEIAHAATTELKDDFVSTTECHSPLIKSAAKVPQASESIFNSWLEKVQRERNTISRHGMTLQCNHQDLRSKEFLSLISRYSSLEELTHAAPEIEQDFSDVIHSNAELKALWESRPQVTLPDQPIPPPRVK